MPGPNQPYTGFDARQVLDHCFDETKDRLRTTGEVQFSGLDSGIQTKKQIIGDVRQKVFPTPLNDRNSFTSRVIGAETVYFGGSDLTIDNGYPKFQYEEFPADIKGDSIVELYAMCEPGKSCEIRTFEAA